jgi:hypothetical protein
MVRLSKIRLGPLLTEPTRPQASRSSLKSDPEANRCVVTIIQVRFSLSKLNVDNTK